jgi:hypothetical protein
MNAQIINSHVHQQLQFLLSQEAQGNTLEQAELNNALRLLSKLRSGPTPWLVMLAKHA